MHKSQAHSRAVQRTVRRSSDTGIKAAHYLVVAFRAGTDNQGRERIYRRVWAETFEDRAVARFLALSTTYAYSCVLSPILADPVAHSGDPAVAERWSAARRGLNRGVDWREAGTYMDRESHHRRTAKEEHDALQRAKAEVLHGE